MTGALGALTFTTAEVQRRRAALDAVMAATGVEHVVLHGANRAGSGVQWLTGWPVTREALVVHSPGRRDVLLVQFYNHVLQAQQLAEAAEVRWAGPQPVATVLEELASRTAGTPGRVRVGVVGALPFQQDQALSAVADVVDLNPAYTTLRTTKSPEELQRLQEAALLTDAACAALQDGAHPGATDHELVALIEGAYVGAGGGHYIHYLAMTSMRSPRQCVPAQWPTGRVLAAGDVLTCELSASVAVDYPGQLLRTFTVAAEPTALVRELHDVADEAVRRIEQLLAPGVTAEQVVAAAEVIEEAGFTTVDDLVHGLGGGYLPPVFGSRSRTLAPLPTTPFTEGMTVVVQPNVTTPDLSIGVQTGELIHVTATGCERLHAFPRGLQRIG